MITIDTSRPYAKRRPSIDEMAQWAIDNREKVLTELGIELWPAKHKKRFLFDASCVKTMGKIQYPETGMGGCDCDVHRGHGWKDYLGLYAKKKNLSRRDAAAELATLAGKDWKVTAKASVSDTDHSGHSDQSYKRTFTPLLHAQILGFLKKKEGISVDGLKAIGTQLGRRLKKLVISIPAYGKDGCSADPVNYVDIRADGSKFEWVNKNGEPESADKMTAARGTNGLVGSKEHIDLLTSGDVTGKRILITAGPTDLAATHSFGIPAEVIAITQIFGEHGIPGESKGTPQIIDLLASSGCEILIAYDVDATGKEASKKLAEHLVGRGCSVKNIDLSRLNLPGKDIRDFLTAGATMQQIIELADSTEPTKEAIQNREICIKPDDPVRLAMENMEAYRASGRDIRFYRGNWYTYKGTHWEQRTDSYIKARLLGFIEHRFKEHCEAESQEYWEKVKKGKEGDSKPPEKRKVSSGLVRNVAEATQTLCLVPDQVEFETLLESRARRNFWPIANGLLDLDRFPADPAAALHPHSPDWFSPFCHEYRYDLEAECPQWLQFLASVFHDEGSGDVDQESIETLQRWFGYCLMPHIRLQKMLILDGVSRSGKGVIARVLKRLIGERYTASPKLRDFAGDFGLQPLLGKRLAVIGDAKLDRYRHDTEAILETLLGVIGEDSLDVNIKRKDAATSCKLGVKFMLLCNGIPTMNDPAMAIVNRVVVLKFKRSFVGAEDTELTEKLYHEIDGIFLWALMGLHHMTHDFRLPQPQTGEEAVESFRKAVSPIRGFVDECCHLRSPSDPECPAYICDRDEFYMAWQGYCEEIGRDRPGTRAALIRQLTNAYPHVIERRPREGESRRFKLVNIELNEVGRKNVTKKRDQAHKQDQAVADSQNESDDDF